MSGSVGSVQKSGGGSAAKKGSGSSGWEPPAGIVLGAYDKWCPAVIPVHPYVEDLPRHEQPFLNLGGVKIPRERRLPANSTFSE